MYTILRIAVFGLLLAGCVALPEQRGIALITTYVNYKSGVDVSFVDVHNNVGRQLGSAGYLIESSNPLIGASLGSIDPEPGLPEWMEFTRKESDPKRRRIPETREEFAAHPLKSARVSVRSVVPSDVIEELRQSPSDPTRANLRLKSLEVYYVWTRAGVKVHWRVHQGCCTVIHEGGDTIRSDSGLNGELTGK